MQNTCFHHQVWKMVRKENCKLEMWLFLPKTLTITADLASVSVLPLVKEYSGITMSLSAFAAIALYPEDMELQVTTL